MVGVDAFQTLAEIGVALAGSTSGVILFVRMVFVRPSGPNP